MPETHDLGRVDSRLAVVAEHDVRICAGQAVAERRRNAPPPRVADVFHLRKLRRQFLGDLARRVGRAVVDDQHIEIVRQSGSKSSIWPTSACSVA